MEPSVWVVCCIKGCEKPVEALGLCVNHWRRNRKYGSPVAYKSHSGLYRGMSAEDRFNAQVKKTSGCWIWAGCTDKHGYGSFRGEVAGVKFNYAHRYSYALHTGDLLVGLQACHKCDNPRCVNPDHLFAGTAKENTQDMLSKGRHTGPIGTKNGKSILTTEQVQLILSDTRPYAKIAADYGVAASTIGSLKQRVSWKSIPGNSAKAPRVGLRGEDGPTAKLTEDNVRFIRMSKERGKDLAAQFSVTQQTITDIRKYRSWIHIHQGDFDMKGAT